MGALQHMSSRMTDLYELLLYIQAFHQSVDVFHKAMCGDEYQAAFAEVYGILCMVQEMVGNQLKAVCNKRSGCQSTASYMVLEGMNMIRNDVQLRRISQLGEQFSTHTKMAIAIHAQYNRQLNSCRGGGVGSAVAAPTAGVSISVGRVRLEGGALASVRLNATMVSCLRQLNQHVTNSRLALQALCAAIVSRFPRVGADLRRNSALSQFESCVRASSGCAAAAAAAADASSAHQG